ncbi:unnamed protein product, partial [Gulo gulo]
VSPAGTPACAPGVCPPQVRLQGRVREVQALPHHHPHPSLLHLPLPPQLQGDRRHLQLPAGLVLLHADHPREHSHQQRLPVREAGAGPAAGTTTRAAVYTACGPWARGTPWTSLGLPVLDVARPHLPAPLSLLRPRKLSLPGPRPVRPAGVPGAGCGPWRGPAPV